MPYINSNLIKVFPCGGRNRDVDPFARLTTEFNLVSIINRLVDKKSFIVTSHLQKLSISDLIDPYIINIGGYLFTVIGGAKAIIDLFAGSDFSQQPYIIAEIKVDEFSTKYDGINMQMLSPMSEVTPDSYTDSILDSNDSLSQFVGLNFKLNATPVLASDRQITLFTYVEAYVKQSDDTGSYIKTDLGFIHKDLLEDIDSTVETYNKEISWTEFEDSKIKFRTTADGSCRSVTIDDGELTSDPQTASTLNLRKSVREIIKPTAVNLNAAEIELEKSATFLLDITCEPLDATINNIEFRTSNSSVATISSNGLITAANEGECFIIATVDNLTAVCQVKVVSEIIEEEKLLEIPAEPIIEDESTKELDSLEEDEVIEISEPTNAEDENLDLVDESTNIVIEEE